MTANDQLTGKSAIAIALARGLSAEQAAAEIGGAGGSTIRRWLRTDPEFVAEVRQYRSELLAGVLGQLTDAATKAVQTLVASLDCDSPQTRVRAALGILSSLLNVRDAADVEERLAILEAAIAERTTTP